MEWKIDKYGTLKYLLNWKIYDINLEKFNEHVANNRRNKYMQYLIWSQGHHFFYVINHCL